MENINEYERSESDTSYYDEKTKIEGINNFGSQSSRVHATNKFTSSIVAQAVSNGTKIPIKQLNSQQTTQRTKQKAVLASDIRTNMTSSTNDRYLKTRRSIKLKGLRLQSLPPELFQFDNLESLTLSPERESCLNYKLTYLPKEIGRLSNLHTLILDTNELDHLPDEIGRLEQLEVLLLSNNFLSTLPHSLHNLSNLKSLHLANNRFIELPKPICGITSLTFLDMTDNDIELIPHEIGNLTKLHTLLLLMNNLEYLPESITQLTSLTSLWLGENRLENLPQTFGELFRLDWGLNPCSANIDGNPLIYPPLGVCREGPLEIRRYFHQKTKSEKMR